MCGCRELHPGQPRKLKGRERSCSRPMPFQQRTDTSCQLALPTRGFTAVVSVFRGTPPSKPLNCKIRFSVSDDPIGAAWAHHAGDDSKLVLAEFVLPSEDITWMSRCFCSHLFVFRSPPLPP